MDTGDSRRGPLRRGRRGWPARSPGCDAGPGETVHRGESRPRSRTQRPSSLAHRDADAPTRPSKGTPTGQPHANRRNCCSLTAYPTLPLPHRSCLRGHRLWAVTPRSKGTRTKSGVARVPRGWVGVLWESKGVARPCHSGGCSYAEGSRAPTPWALLLCGTSRAVGGREMIVQRVRGRLEWIGLNCSRIWRPKKTLRGWPNPWSTLQTE